MTCSRTGGLPVVGGGATTCLWASFLNTALPMRWALKPMPVIARRAALIVVGSVAFRNNMAAALAGLKLFLSILRSRLRMFIDTSPKSILTGQGVTHLWHTVQWSATSSNSSQCLIDTPRRVCSSYRKASISEDVARILLRGEYSRLARGTWVAQTGLHLPQRRQSFTLSAIAPMSDCCMISDSWHIRTKLGV